MWQREDLYSLDPPGCAVSNLLGSLEILGWNLTISFHTSREKIQRGDAHWYHFGKSEMQ